MTTTARFFDSTAGDRIYTSADLSKSLQGIVGDGYAPGRGDECAVIEADPAAMSVVVSTGHVWVQGRNLEVVTAETLTVTTAHASNPRIDRVVAYLDYTARTGGVKVVAGTAAVSPTAPALVQTGSEWQISLALVDVAATVTSIVTADITDERSEQVRIVHSGGMKGIDATDNLTLWALPDAATSSVVGGTDVPAEWSTADIVVRFLGDATAGDVRLRSYHLNTTAGADSASNGSWLTVTPGTGVMTDATLLSGLDVSAMESIAIGVTRDGADGADTYTAGLSIAQMRLVKAG